MVEGNEEVWSPKNRCPNCEYYGRMRVTYRTQGDSRRIDITKPLLKCPRCNEVF